MIDLSELTLSSPLGAAPGSILFQAARSPLCAAWLSIGGGGPRNALTLDSGKRGFKVMDSRHVRGPFLQVRDPHFVVDPSSAITGTDSMPPFGTIFLTSRGSAILAQVGHAECGVGLDGALLETIDYANFAGFRHWRIETRRADDEPAAAPHGRAGKARRWL